MPSIFLHCTLLSTLNANSLSQACCLASDIPSSVTVLILSKGILSSVNTCNKTLFSSESSSILVTSHLLQTAITGLLENKGRILL
uniref:Putative secreted protein n=1 Tax=Panstrongylus lignarius TaxID=156445 RepID=A0A224Y2S8_9HEMI